MVVATKEETKRFELACDSPDLSPSLEWDRPLQGWHSEELSQQFHGQAGDGLYYLASGQSWYVLREVARSESESEFSLMKALADYGLPVIKPVLRVLERRDGDTPLDDLIVAVLPGNCLPLGTMMAQSVAAPSQLKLAESLAQFLVHLHLAGFHWKQDAVVDPLIHVSEETGEFTAFLLRPYNGSLYQGLSDLERAFDLEMVRRSLEAIYRSSLQPGGLDALTLMQDFIHMVLAEYRQIWGQISKQQLCESRRDPRRSKYPVVPTSSVPLVAHTGHLRLLVHTLTGLDTDESRSRKVLQDIHRYQAWLEFSSGRPWPRALAANRWLNDLFMPALLQFPCGTKLAGSGAK